MRYRVIDKSFPFLEYGDEFEADPDKVLGKIGEKEYTAMFLEVSGIIEEVDNEI